MSLTGAGLKTRMVVPASAAYRPGTAGIVSDWVFGTPPAPVVDIPYRWLAMGLAIRQEPVINDMRVSRVDGIEARRIDQDSIDARQVGPGSATLDTAVAADTVSLAAWTVAMFASPRDRCPRVTIDLLDRTKLTELDARRLLGIEVGTRILITDAPSTWPPGMERLVVDGIRHSLPKSQHLLTLITSQVIGHTPGTVGPWWQIDQTPLDSGPPIAF